MSSGYGAWQMKIKFLVGTKVDVLDDELVFFSGIWLYVTGTSGSRHFDWITGTNGSQHFDSESQGQTAPDISTLSHRDKRLPTFRLWVTGTSGSRNFDSWVTRTNGSRHFDSESQGQTAPEISTLSHKDKWLPKVRLWVTRTNGSRRLDCLTGTSGSQLFERSFFLLHLEQFPSGLSKTRSVDCRVWPTQVLIFKTFYCLFLWHNVLKKSCKIKCKN